jgi:hypothetical protein
VKGAFLATTIAELAKAHPLPLEVIAALREIVASTGKGEDAILQVFYALLTEDDAAKSLNPKLLAALRGTVLGSRQPRALRSILMARLVT